MNSFSFFLLLIKTNIYLKTYKMNQYVLNVFDKIYYVHDARNVSDALSQIIGIMSDDQRKKIKYLIIKLRFDPIIDEVDYDYDYPSLNYIQDLLLCDDDNEEQIEYIDKHINNPEYMKNAPIRLSEIYKLFNPHNVISINYPSSKPVWILGYPYYASCVIYADDIFDVSDIILDNILNLSDDIINYILHLYQDMYDDLKGEYVDEIFAQIDPSKLYNSLINPINPLKLYTGLKKAYNIKYYKKDRKYYKVDFKVRLSYLVNELL